MALGRPAMISNFSSDIVILPKEVDEETFQEKSQIGKSGDRIQTTEIPEANTSLLSFFVQSAKLYDIVQDVLRSFYTDDRKRKNTSLASYFIGSGSVFELENRLAGWYASIPPHIQLDSVRSTTLDNGELHWIFFRQAVVLRLRYLHARLYLLRPVLSKVCTAGRNRATEPQTANTYESTEPPSSLIERTALQCSFTCIKAAIELIEVANEYQTTAENWGQKPSWLYGVLHIYLAAIVLLAARLAPATTLGEISDIEIQESWEHALQLLRHFQSDSASAQRCVAALEVLYRKLPGNGLVNDSASRQPSSPRPVMSNTNGPPEALPTNEPIERDVGFWPMENSEWTADFDFSDPYDMSWFQIAPHMSFT